MKKIYFLLLLLTLGTNIAQLKAQTFVENNPCSAICLDPAKTALIGKLAPPNNLSPNAHLPCGGGTTEDNPSWWFFRPRFDSLKFSLTATNCTIGGANLTGVEMTLWEGDCNNGVTALQCITGTSGVLLVKNVAPCKSYYLQIDGRGESVCDVTINYDNNQILKQVDKPVITGPDKACKGSSAALCASIPSMNGCQPDNWKWSVEPSSAGTIVSTSNCPTLKLTGIVPPNGKVNVCAEPVFKGQCLPNVQKECLEIEVYDLKPATCDITLCPESRPFIYDLIQCVKTTNPTVTSFTPETFIISKAFLPGMTAAKNISYSVVGSGCKNNITLNVKILADNKITLPPIILCEGDTKIVKGAEFTCAAASNALKTIKKETSEADKAIGACDTTFQVLVQCMKVVLPKFPTSVLDCNNTAITLNAGTSGTITIPSSINTTSFTGKGTRAYTWSKDGITLADETNPTLVVTSAGKYEVTLSYTYEVTQTIDNVPVVVARTCSKSTSVEVTKLEDTVVAETPTTITTPCLSGINDTASYHISPAANAKYTWSVTGNATILNGNTGASVLVKSGGAAYQVCLEKTICNKKDNKCIDVKPIAVPNAKASVNSPICATSSALFNASGGDFYQWSGPNNFSASVQNPILTNVETKNTGSYSVTVSNSPNCKSVVTVNLEVKNCIATKDVLAEAAIGIFPNPIQNSLIVSANSIIQKVELLNALGQILISQNVDNQKISINTSALSSGVYVAKVYIEKDVFKEFKVVKE
jgi:hypothetical protein